MKKYVFGICLVALLSGCAGVRKEVKTTEPFCYTREVINARMSAWYNKDAQVGFANANSTNGIVEPAMPASWDYQRVMKLPPTIDVG